MRVLFSKFSTATGTWHIAFLKGQNDDAVESLTKAAEVCKDAVILKGEIWRHQTGTVLDLGMLLKDMGRLPEALCALEEAYSICCEWTGPSDQSLQIIAVEIAELLRKTGDLERAEHFSRVTYEVMKEHHNAAAESLGLRSAAGGRCQILSDMFLQNSVVSPTSSNEDNVLEEAEALAREALAGARAENRNIVEALRRLIVVLVQLDRGDGREIYQLTLRFIRLFQSASPQSRKDRSGLASGYHMLASLLRVRLHQEEGTVGKGNISVGNVDTTGIAKSDTKREETGDEAVVPATATEDDDDAGEIDRDGGDDDHDADDSDEEEDEEVDEEGDFDEDEWNRTYMQMRAFYCLLGTVALCTIQQGNLHDLDKFIKKLESATFYVVEDLVNLGQLDLCGNVARWRGTTWEAFVAICKRKVDYAVQNNNGDTETRIGAGEVNATAFDAVGDENRVAMADAEEKKVQLGFAYWALGRVLLKIANGDMKLMRESNDASGTVEIEEGSLVNIRGSNDTVNCIGDADHIEMDEKVTLCRSKIDHETVEASVIVNRRAVLEEAEIALNLASGFFEKNSRLLGTAATEKLLKNLQDGLSKAADESK
jgi:tetratricopeptide (TPR) repeat protein